MKFPPERRFSWGGSFLVLFIFCVASRILLKKNTSEGMRYAESLVAKAIQQNNAAVLELAYLRLIAEKKSKALVTLAVQAAEALVHINAGTDAYSLLRLAEAYSINGDKAKSREYAQRAISAAADEPLKNREKVAKEARRFGAKK